jgi:hypothetical protein
MTCYTRSKDRKEGENHADLVSRFVLPEPGDIAHAGTCILEQASQTVRLMIDPLDVKSLLRTAGMYYLQQGRTD